MQHSISVRLFTVVLVLVGASACMPDAFNRFDRKSAFGTVERAHGQNIALRDTRGGRHILSDEVTVNFEINRLSDAVITLSSGNQSSKFNVPKSVLFQGGSYIDLLAYKSGQEVDLRMRESVTVLSQWSRLRHEQDPITINACDGNGNCSTTTAGSTDSYYRDTYGWVDRAVELEFFERWNQFSDGHKLGTVRAIVTHREERLHAQRISYTEFQQATE